MGLSRSRAQFHAHVAHRVCRYGSRRDIWASANRRLFSKTDKRQVVLELGLEGKFAAKSTGWDEKPGFPEGDKLEVAVKNGRWVLTHLPAKPPEPKPVLRYFPDE